MYQNNRKAIAKQETAVQTQCKWLSTELIFGISDMLRTLCCVILFQCQVINNSFLNAHVQQELLRYCQALI